MILTKVCKSTFICSLLLMIGLTPVTSVEARTKQPLNTFINQHLHFIYDAQYRTVNIAHNTSNHVQQQSQTVLILSIGSNNYIHNGRTVTSDAAPFIDNLYNRTMVPLRLIAEGLGAQVDWDRNTRTVHINHGQMHLSLHIDSTLPGGMGMPSIRNGRTFVPVRYVSEALGAEVIWDRNARSVTVIYNQSSMHDVVQYNPQYDYNLIYYIPPPLEDIKIDEDYIGYTGGIPDPEPFKVTGEWSPFYSNQFVGGYWFTTLGFRISGESFLEMYTKREQILTQIIKDDMCDFEKIRAVNY